MASRYALLIMPLMFVLLSVIFDQVTDTLKISSQMVTDIQQPFVHDGDRYPIDLVHRGDIVYVHYAATFLKACRKSTVQMRLIQTAMDENPKLEGKNEAMLSFPLMMASVGSGPLEWNELIEIPSRIPTGRYRLRRTSFLTCGINEWSQIYPDIELMIIK